MSMTHCVRKERNTSAMCDWMKGSFMMVDRLSSDTISRELGSTVRERTSDDLFCFVDIIALIRIH